MWEYGSRVTFLRVVGTELQKYVTHDSRLSPPLLVRLSWVTLPHFHCLRYLVSVLMSEVSTSPHIQLDLHGADAFMGGFCRRLKLPRRIIFVDPQNLSIFSKWSGIFRLNWDSLGIVFCLEFLRLRPNVWTKFSMNVEMVKLRMCRDFSIYLRFQIKASYCYTLLKISLNDWLEPLPPKRKHLTGDWTW